MSFSEVSIAVIIYPDPDDRWDLSDYTPFESELLSGVEQGFILANTEEISVDFEDFHLLPARFLGIGDILNKVDFIQKTFEDSSGSNKSIGIGGLAKLKDLSIKLVNRFDLYEERLYDRKFEIRVYESSNLSNDTDGEYKSHFFGSLFSVSYEKMHTITLNLQGLIASNNPRINGEPFVNDKGDVINTWIVLGDTNQDNLVKLEKKKGSEGVQLHIDSSKYKIKKLYVKENNIDEFYPVTSSWEVNNDKLYFSSDTVVRLIENIDATEDTIKVVDGTYVTFDTSLFLDNSDYFYITVSDPPASFTGVLQFFITNRTSSTYTGITFPYLENEYTREYFTNLHKNLASGSIKVYTSDNSEFFKADSTDITNLVSNFFISNEESIKHTRRLYTDNWQDYQGNIGLSYPQWYHKYNDRYAMFHGDYGKDIKKWNNVMDYSFLTEYDEFQHILKIGDERMLILDQDLSSIAPYGYKKIKVIRGYDDTEAVSHTTDEDVLDLSSDSSRTPTVKVIKEVTDLLQDPEISHNFTDNYKNFKSGDAPYKWRINFYNVKQYDYLYLKISIPDITGDLEGDPYLRYNLVRTKTIVNSNTYNQRTAVGIALAISPSEEKIFTDEMRLFNPSYWNYRGLSTQHSPEFMEKIYNSYMNVRNHFGYNSYYMKNEDKVIGDFDKTASYIINYDNSESDRLTLYGWNVGETDHHMSRDNNYVNGRFLYELTSLKFWYSPEGQDDFEEPDETNLFILKGSSSYGSGGYGSEVTAWYHLVFKYYGNFNIINYDSFKNVRFALKAFSLNRNFSGSMDISINHLDLRYYLKCPIKDNDWYAEVKYKGVDINTDFPITTYALGDNGSIYLIEHDGKDYLFAESDQKSFLIFELSKTGILFLKDEATLIDFPDLSVGNIQLFKDDDKVGKVSKITGGYAYVQTNLDTESTFPVIVQTQIESTNLSNVKIVGDDEQETDDLYIIVDDGYIKVFSKQEIQDANPVTVLKQLLLDYVDHDGDDLDLTSFNDVKTLCDERSLRCTIILQKETNANNIVNELCSNFGFILFENNQGKIALKHIYPPVDEDTTIDILPFNIETECLFDDSGIPEIDIERIDLKYIITDLILRYNQFGDKYKEEVLSEDLPSGHQKLLENARLYNKNSTEVALGLRCVSDKVTAEYCSYLKLLFHSKPTRYIKLQAKPEWIEKDLGTWFSIPSNDFILDTSGKLYLLVSVKANEPFGLDKTFVEMELFEFDTSILQIQEVPSNTRSENYDEQITDTEQIQEVPDVFS